MCAWWSTWCGFDEWMNSIDEWERECDESGLGRHKGPPDSCTTRNSQGADVLCSTLTGPRSSCSLLLRDHRSTPPLAHSLPLHISISLPLAVPPTSSISASRQSSRCASMASSGNGDNRANSSSAKNTSCMSASGGGCCCSGARGSAAAFISSSCDWLMPANMEKQSWKLWRMASIYGMRVANSTWYAQMGNRISRMICLETLCDTGGVLDWMDDCVMFARGR